MHLTVCRLRYGLIKSLDYLPRISKESLVRPVPERSARRPMLTQVPASAAEPAAPAFLKPASGRRLHAARGRAPLRLVLLSAFALMLLSFVADAAEKNPRTVMSLDGTWELGEGSMDQAPAQFDHKVPVPGLVSLAVPPFVEPGPVVKDRNATSQIFPRRDAFWYRRRFKVGPIPAVATLKIGKAMFVARVLLNGKSVGDHLPCFIPGLFDVRAFLVAGENELLIRVGADREAVGSAIPSGFDFEKTRYIPGIFDSVELILFRHAVHHGIAGGSRPAKSDDSGPGTLGQSRRFRCFSVAIHGARGQIRQGPFGASHRGGFSRTKRRAECYGRHSHPRLSFLVPGRSVFVYPRVDTDTDRSETRFGMRSFQFDATNHLALLNGKPYPMRGSNMTLYRFFEDSECGNLPWEPIGCGCFTGA